jgi:hypothetical protein
MDVDVAKKEKTGGDKSRGLLRKLHLPVLRSSLTVPMDGTEMRRNWAD